MTGDFTFPLRKQIEFFTLPLHRTRLRIKLLNRRLSAYCANQSIASVRKPTYDLTRRLYQARHGILQQRLCRLRRAPFPKSLGEWRESYVSVFSQALRNFTQRIPQRNPTFPQKLLISIRHMCCCFTGVNPASSGWMFELAS
jgi:hypothetical protein